MPCQPGDTDPLSLCLASQLWMHEMKPNPRCEHPSLHPPTAGEPAWSGGYPASEATESHLKAVKELIKSRETQKLQQRRE